MSQKLPWFLRGIDRLVDRHEKYVTELHGSPDYHRNLLRWASVRDERAREWLAEALSRYEFALASRIWVFYLIGVLLFGFFALGFGVRGCGIALLLLLLVPVMNRIDRRRRRTKAWRALAEGEPSIYLKERVEPPPKGSRVFQSYWSQGELHNLELDHPIELWDAVNQANEWWQFRMPVPHDSNGRVNWLTVNMDLGLVRRHDNGRRELLAGGVVYFSYDPWADRIDTGDYKTTE